MKMLVSWKEVEMTGIYFEAASRQNHEIVFLDEYIRKWKISGSSHAICKTRRNNLYTLLYEFSQTKIISFCKKNSRNRYVYVYVYVFQVDSNIFIYFYIYFLLSLLSINNLRVYFRHILQLVWKRMYVIWEIYF